MQVIIIINKSDGHPVTGYKPNGLSSFKIKPAIERSMKKFQSMLEKAHIRGEFQQISTGGH